jgi:hypothetical protein
MATNKQTPCKGGCGKLAYGDRCRACSFALKPISARVGKPQRCRTDHPSVNTVGEFNASGGFAGPAGIAFPKVAPTAGSWWAEHLTREEHQRMADAHSRRMSAGPCGNHRADNLGVINWNY